MESPSSPLRPNQGDGKVTREPRKKFAFGNGSVVAFLGLTIVGCLVVLPRPTYPQVLPLPRIERAEKLRTEREEISRAIAARDGSLDHQTRAVGEQIRRIGLILATAKPVDGVTLGELRKDVEALLKRPAAPDQISGEEALLQLRALQGQMFLQAVHTWEEAKVPQPDLQELGGPFQALASDGWLDPEGHLLLDDDALRLFFRVHWSKLTGLSHRHPFEASLEELRRYYLTNLLYPRGAKPDVMGRTLHQIAFVRALGKVDNQYPSLLALGILELRVGQYLIAQGHLKDHLARHPEGRWAALARNHLILATNHASSLIEDGF